MQVYISVLLEYVISKHRLLIKSAHIISTYYDYQNLNLVLTKLNHF